MVHDKYLVKVSYFIYLPISLSNGIVTRYLFGKRILYIERGVLTHATMAKEFFSTVTDPQPDLLLGIFLPLIVGFFSIISGGWL